METPAPPGYLFSQQCCSCGASAAGCWCVDCSELLCDTCVAAHRRVTVTRSHRILDQPDGGVSIPPIKFCRLHPSETLKLFCYTCHQLTCRDCQLTTHMNHRYEFVSQVMDGVRKQLEAELQPIRAQRDTVRRSLLDMETRLRNIDESESHLKQLLLQSFSYISQLMRKRMQNILCCSEAAYNKEREALRRRIQRLKGVQQNLQSASDAAERAQRCGEVAAALLYSAQVHYQLRTLVDQTLSPPQTMTELKVVTDKNCLETILNFGKLQTLRVPFSVPPASDQISLVPSCRPPDPPVPVLCRPSLSGRSVPMAMGTRSSQESVSAPPADAPASCVLVQMPLVLTSIPANCQVRPRMVSQEQKSLPPTCPSSSFWLLPLNIPTNDGGPSHSTQNSLSNQLRLLPPSCLSTASPPSSKPLPQTMTTDSPVPGGLDSSSSNDFGPPPSSTLLTAASCKPLPQNGSTNDDAAAQLVTPPPTYRPLPPSDSLLTSTPSGVPLPCDVTSCSVTQQSLVVRAVADSACDRGVQEVMAKLDEPAENEPTSTVCEQPEPTGAEECSSLIGQLDFHLSQWQPRVSLVRLPASLSQPGRPLSGFSVDGAEDGEESSGDPQLDVDDFALSPPESPVRMEVIACSACSLSYASIICTACGRGFHRVCHVPPVGPDLWSEWICSLCQDLADPTDPYSSDRPQRPECPGLSLLDQRRCERLLLFLTVEACGRVSEFGSIGSRLKTLSENLSVRRTYETAAEFTVDLWSVFRDPAKDDGALRGLWGRLMETFRSDLLLDLHPDRAQPQGSKVTAGQQEAIIRRPKAPEPRKRLQHFLVESAAKRRRKHQEGD